MKDKFIMLKKFTTLKEPFLRRLSVRQSSISLVLLIFILFGLFFPSLSLAKRYYRHFKHHYKHAGHYSKKMIHKRYKKYRKVVYRKRYRYRHRYHRHYRRYVVRRPVVIHPKNVNPVSKEKDVRIQELLNGQ